MSLQHGIRQAYYASTGHDDQKSSHQEHSDPAHIRHCMDYLRQSLMCAADSTLEPVNFALGGVTGWGFKRQCRDYSALVEWSDKWRMYNSSQIS
jgi:hypothetical protein